MNICSCILNAGLFMEEYMLSFVQEFINRLVHHQTGEFLWQQACYCVETLLKSSSHARAAEVKSLGITLRKPFQSPLSSP